MTTTTGNKKLTIKGDYFYGNEISDYGKEHNRVDYRTLAKAFDAIDAPTEFMNTVWNSYYGTELENGNDYDEENERPVDIFQYYIINENGADLLKRWTDEIVYYSPDTGLYIWGVTHWGTSWDYVLTDIEIER